METKQKTVSVIVPVYNTEKQLPRCIGSLRNQTYKELEILLIDDGSGDGSLKLCEKAAGEDKRIKVIRKENGGVSSARNEGLSQAGGELIMFVDSDDWIEPDMIERMVRAEKEFRVPLVICDYERTQEKRRQETLTKAGVLSSKEILWKYLEEDEEIRIPHSVWGKLFRRELIGTKRFPLIKRTEELLFSTGIFCEAKSCAYLPERFYHYCDERTDSLMHEADASHTVKQEIPLLLSQIQMIEEAGFKEEAQLSWVCFGKRLLYFYLAFRDKRLMQEARAVTQYAGRNRKKILKALSGGFVKKSDRLRIGLFTICPWAYYLIAPVIQNLQSMRKGKD